MTGRFPQRMDSCAAAANEAMIDGEPRPKKRRGWAQGKRDRMVELIIEHWRNLDGSNQYLWSLWRDGKRVGVSRPTETQDGAEQQGMDWCLRSTGGGPDRVTRL